MNTEYIADYLCKSVEWSSFFVMLKTLGDDLNDRKDRFDKASIIEYSLEIFSDKKIRWVDEIGRDHFIDDLDIAMEMKFIKSAKYTYSKKLPKKNVKVKLTNTIGSSYGRTLPNTFDCLLIASEYDVSIIKYEDLLQYVESAGDGLVATIPFDKLYDVSLIDETNALSLLENNRSVCNYKQEKAEAISRFLAQFIN